MSILLHGHLAMSATTMTTTTMPVQTRSKTATTTGSILLSSRQKPSAQTRSSSSVPADHAIASHPSDAAEPRKNILSQIRWFNLIVVTLGPALSIYGFCTTELRKETLAFTLLGYVINMFGESSRNMIFCSH